MRLANRLRDLRREAGMTQAALATRVEVSRKTVNTIENRAYLPSTLLALRLADVLGCRVEDIFSLEP